MTRFANIRGGAGSQRLSSAAMIFTGLLFAIVCAVGASVAAKGIANLAAHNAAPNLEYYR